MKLFPLWLVFFFLFSVHSECFAGDFGFLLNQKLLLSGGEESSTEYTGSAIPWFSSPLGDRADFYLSGGISAHYDDEAWKPLPEIYRFEFIYNPSPDLRVEFGRLPFRESLSYVASGLFDGLAAGYNINGGRFSAGLFYTGLLYKKAAYIFMSPDDKNDLADTDKYFASRRIIAALNWEKTSVFDTRSGLALSGLCQFDLNDSGTTIHSQYLEAKFTLPLGAAFNTVSGVVIETAKESGRVFAAFALSLDVQWLPPGGVQDMVTFTGRFSSGDWNGRWGAFVPISAEAQGRVLRPVLSGIALVEAFYTARLCRALAADVSASYYFRTDTGTYDATGIGDSASPLVGAEVYGGVSWSPYSDVLLSLGAGAFFPGTGRAFSDDSKIKYRVEMTAGISL
ncbi:MAG: hypothetical protein LBI85_00040 [Spirochaetaceae bacterium]|jgi:hypothetical protein|nr:hypothetical protein [Spirochaetaceae bacterium]